MKETYILFAALMFFFCVYVYTDQKKTYFTHTVPLYRIKEAMLIVAATIFWPITLVAILLDFISVIRSE
jgi:hypothetical protein